VLSKQYEHPDIFAEDVGDPFHRKTDLVLTLGGDGTILHAASLFSTAKAVPPMLSFSMGSLGFLGECHWKDHVKAFLTAIGKDSPDMKGYSGEFGVLRRGRLKVGVFDKVGKRVAGEDWAGNNLGDVHVMNEVDIHRGAKPHLAIVEVFVAGRKLTEAVVSQPFNGPSFLTDVV
jgi:NADH kinase